MRGGERRSEQLSKQGRSRTYVVVKVHEVGDHLDVGVVDPGLADDLLQHVSQPRREDEDGHAVLLQAVEELLVAVPVSNATRRAEVRPGWGKTGGGSPAHACRLWVHAAYLRAASDSLTTSTSLSFSNRCSTSSEWEV